MRRSSRTLFATLLFAPALLGSASQDTRELPGKPGVSPGPPGRAPGEKFRVELLWMDEPYAYPAGNYGRRLDFGGVERFYEVHVPPGYVAGRPTPVVFALHGGGGTAGPTRFISQIEPVSDTNGFLVVYPAGTRTKRFLRDLILVWNVGFTFKYPWVNESDDVGFISTIIDDLERYFAVDRRRVYVTGLSNGGAMSYRLAAELSDRIAAVAPLAGQLAYGQLDWKPPSRSVPIMHFHGLLDPFNRWEGNVAKDSLFEDAVLHPVPEVLSSWAQLYGCDGELAEDEARGAATRLSYRGCPEGIEVVLWKVANGGHTWPGGRVTQAERTGKILGIQVVEQGVGPVSDDIYAAELIWEFFERHALPESAGGETP